MSEYKNGSLVGGGGGAFSSLVITEDGSGIVATDASTGATAFFLDLAASTNNSLDLAGNGWVQIPDADPGLRFTSGSIWVKFTPNSASDGYVMRKTLGSPYFTEYRMYFYGASSNKFYIKVPLNNNFSYSILSSGTTPVGTSAQGCVTYDNTTIRLYLNGSADGTYAISADLDNNNNDPWILGADSIAGVTKFDGILEGYAMFNTILTPTEVSNLNGGTTDPTDITGCLGWWKFNEGTPVPPVDGTVIASYPAGNNGTCEQNTSPTGSMGWISSSTPFTLANPSGLEAGRSYTWIIESGGNRSASFGSLFKSESGSSLQITQTAGGRDLLRGTVNSDGTEIWCEILKNFS